MSRDRGGSGHVDAPALFRTGFTGHSRLRKYYNTAMPEAGERVPYFITFTTYGARLHGDARGSVDVWHNRYGEPTMPARPGLEAYEQGRMKTAPVLLNAAMRSAVEDAIRERCRFMDWALLAINVRTNHVHVVVGANEAPEKVMNSMKARSTSLMRTQGLVGVESRVWARHGSTRRLTTHADVEAAVKYVAEGQGPDLPRG